MPKESASKKKISLPIIIVISVVPALLFILLVAFIVSRIRRKPGLQASPSDIQLDASCQQFTHADLVQITNNFIKVIGQGGFGTVYHGYLKSGKQVAVKMLSKSSSQGTREFLAEAQSLTRIHHRNLVSLVGLCTEEENLALVYEYMPQGSLTDHLRGKVGNYKVLSWENRLRIAVDSAQGLEYLHKGCNPPLIHRDVKSGNILLGDELEAKIADFGLSRAFQTDGQSYVSTKAIVGTPGYLDPEYYKSLKLSDKSDVYSFGIVLLEIITGQPPIVVGESDIVQQVTPTVQRGDIDDIVDKNLKGEYDTNSLWKVVDLAMMCVAEYGNQRPRMTSVVIQLKESLELQVAYINENQHSQNFDTSQTFSLEKEQTTMT